MVQARVSLWCVTSKLITGYDDLAQQPETAALLTDLTESLKDSDMNLKVRFDRRLHDVRGIVWCGDCSEPKDPDRKPPEISPLIGKPLLISGCPGGDPISEAIGAVALPNSLEAKFVEKLHSFRHLR